MTARSFALALSLAAVSLAFIPNTARAAEPASRETDEARDQFKQGAAFAKDAQWGAALAAFERSLKLRPHPWTTYNIGVCERALGQYVRARRTFNRALAERKPDADLPEATVTDIKRFLTEIDGLVASLDVTLAPEDAALAIDGQPLEGDAANASGKVPTLLAGTLPAGPGQKPPSGHFRVVMDPGTHVLLITHDGFSDALDTETLRPGENRPIELSITKLPATLDIAANRTDAVVTVNGIDVGVAPVRLSRPAGAYHVLVRKPGFVPYESDATLRPGQKTDLRAALKPEQPSIFRKWWFWTAAGVVVAGAATTTFFLTRPDPTRPAIDGGGLNWSVRLP